MVRSLVNWAVAPAIVEPAESVTVPEIWPVTLCAQTLDDATNKVENNVATMRMLFIKLLFPKSGKLLYAAAYYVREAKSRARSRVVKARAHYGRGGRQ